MRPPAEPSTRLVLGALLTTSFVAFGPALGRTFVSPDDWVRIDLVAGLLVGEPGVFWAALRGASPLEALRLTALPLWLLDYRLHGFDTGPYFLLNILGLQACGLCVFALARRLIGSSWLGLTGASLFLFNAATAQPLHFLAARDDPLATLFCLALAASWHRLQRSAAGLVLAHALFLLALLAKAPAVALPGALLALDVLEGRGRLWARLREPAGWLRGSAFASVIALYGWALAWTSASTRSGACWRAEDERRRGSCRSSPGSWPRCWPRAWRSAAASARSGWPWPPGCRR